MSEHRAAPQQDGESASYEAIGRYAVREARWIRHEHEHYAAVPVAFGANLESPGMRFDALLKAACAPQEGETPCTCKDNERCIEDYGRERGWTEPQLAPGYYCKRKRQPPAESGPRPEEPCLFGTFEGSAACLVHGVYLQRAEASWICPEAGTPLPFGSEITSVRALLDQLQTLRERLMQKEERIEELRREIARLRRDVGLLTKARDGYDEDRRKAYQEVGGWKERAERAEQSLRETQAELKQERQRGRDGWYRRQYGELVAGKNDLTNKLAIAEQSLREKDAALRDAQSSALREAADVIDAQVCWIDSDDEAAEWLRERADAISREGR